VEGERLYTLTGSLIIQLGELRKALSTIQVQASCMVAVARLKPSKSLGATCGKPFYSPPHLGLAYPSALSECASWLARNVSNERDADTSPLSCY